MGFFDSLKSGFQRAQVQYQKDMQNVAKKALRERGDSLSSEQKKRLEKVASGVVSTRSSSSNTTNSSSGQQREMTVNDWERKWESIGVLSTIDLSPFSSYVGVYKAVLGGEIKYIGRAIEFQNGGFRKRLSDYRRESDSARKHKSGKLMYENADSINISIIKTGTDAEAASVAKELERMLVAKYNPEWNTMLKSKVL